MTWTPESLAKAAATRIRKAAERAQAAEDQAQGVVRYTGHLTPPANGSPIPIPAAPAPPPAPPPPEFDFLHAPLPDAMARLGDLRRAYDAAARIVLTRQSAAPARWTCYTELHKDTMPKSVLRLCARHGEDGKWKFRDDGVFRVVDGLRVADPVYCCSAICCEYYLKSKQSSGLSRH